LLIGARFLGDGEMPLAALGELVGIGRENFLDEALVEFGIACVASSQ